MKLYGKNTKGVELSEVRVAVFGLGKMGLPLSAVFAQEGFDVIGVDIDDDVVERVNKGEAHIKNEPFLDEMVARGVKRGNLKATTEGPSAVAESDVMIILTPTLLRYDGNADLTTVKTAAKGISKGLEEGDLVVLESTVPPGTTQNVLKPLLDRSGAQDYGLAYCPERTASGRAIQDIRGAYPKIVGGIDEESGATAETIYEKINSRGFIRVSDATTAEAVKVFEGVYRDVNIALANQLARISSEYGFDALEAIDAANTQPFCDIHDPGCGVGGHCIPVYSHFLLEPEGRESCDLLRTARRVNEAMPGIFVDLLMNGLEKGSKDPSEARVLLLGLAFRGGVDETRFSPGVDIAERLKGSVGELVINDPVVKDIRETFGFDSTDLEEVDFTDFDAILICTDHKEYRDIDWSKKKNEEGTLLIDGRNLYESEKMTEIGFRYMNVGSSISR